MLQFPPKWRFEAPRYADQRRNFIQPDAIAEFIKLIKIVSSQGPEKQILEHYKRRFSTATGVPYYPSSNIGWAETDLESVMTQAAQNPPVFVEAFYDAGEILRTQHSSISIPDVEMINDILNRHGLALKIEGTNLIAADTATLAIPISEMPLSLAEQARQQLMASSKRADTLLAGRDEGSNLYS